jgi:hypothetical protein
MVSKIIKWSFAAAVGLKTQRIATHKQIAHSVSTG